MSVRFIGQPFSEDAQIGRALADALREPAMTNLWIAAAWAKRSGLGRIRPVIAEFAARRGTSEVIVGIDEGGATREGLSLCLEVFTETFIYHDPGTPTFHPKIYVVEGPERAVLAVGSGNLTKGGLFTNYEAAFVVEATRDTADEWELRGDVRAYFDRLLNAGDAIRPLDEDLIERLEAEGWVTSEVQQNARRSTQSRERRAREPLFGAPVRGLAGAPPPDLPPLPQEDEDEDAALPAPGAEPLEEPVPEEPAQAEEEDSPAGTIGFWKQLSSSDASHTSSPGQIIIPIRYLDFFPQLSDEEELTEGLGSGQSAAYFDASFVDGAFTKEVNARVILYEPAPQHPRPNREVRFTFHDREVLDRLSEGDVLVFTRSGDDYRVERRVRGSMGDGRFGNL